uniref:Archaemetzincin n=1 Tax=Thermogladius calderae TaxID=1200300 RepID=A0A7J3Y0A4_9CREN
MVRVYLVPLTATGFLEYVDTISSLLEDSFTSAGVRLETYNWPEVVRPSLKCYDWGRMQYIASCVVEELYKKTSTLDTEGYSLGVGMLDAYEPGLNFVFGLAVPAKKTAAVFTKRLREEYYGKPARYDLYVERVAKEVTHELGHLLGLQHCGDRKCVMSFSNNVVEVDYKTRFFCEKCAVALKTMASHYMSRTK